MRPSGRRDAAARGRLSAAVGGRSAQFGDRRRSRPRGRSDDRNGWKQSRDVASPYCCSDEPALGPSACSRPSGGRLSNRITLVWAPPLRPAKHQRGSGSPASMASDVWIAASMRQSNAEIDTIAARPLRRRASHWSAVTLPDLDVEALSSAPTGTAAAAAICRPSDSATRRRAGYRGSSAGGALSRASTRVAARGRMVGDRLPRGSWPRTSP